MSARALLCARSFCSCYPRWQIAPVQSTYCKPFAVPSYPSQRRLTAQNRYKLVQSSSSQEQTEGNAQQGVFIASSIFWTCCSIAAASLAHRTRQSYLALIRHNSQVTNLKLVRSQSPILTPCHQVQPFHETSVVDAGSRIVPSPAYGHVPMTHASVPIGISALLLSCTHTSC